MNVRPESRQIDLAREPAFRLGSADVQPATREFLVGDAREVLEPRVMQVLVALARRRGEVVSREELTISCWNGRVVGDDAVSRCITAVRRLASAYGGFSLETIPRVGYRLIEDEPVPQPSEPVTSAGVEQPGAESPAWIVRHKWRAAIIASAVLVMLLMIIIPMHWPHPSARPNPQKLTVAVLPFTPLYAGDGGQQLGDAITISVADVLAGSALDVVSPTRSLQFRGAAKADAAHALRADFLIDGDIRREAGKAIVALRLVEGSSGKTLVAASMERPLSEAADLPDDVAKQFAQLGSVSRGSKPTAGWDPRVVAGYFRATFQYAGRNDFYGANETARAVVKSAPNDALAQSLHGFMAAYLVSVLPPDRRPAMIEEARQAAERAIQLDPGLGDSYAVLALTTPLFDWTAREAHLRRGLAAFSESLPVQIQLIELLQNAGRFRESAPLAEQAFRYTPYQTRSLIDLINARLWVGDVRESRVLIDHGRKFYPRSLWFEAKMFEATAFHGDHAGALSMLHGDRAEKLLVPDGSMKVFSNIALALIHQRPSDVRAVTEDCRSPEGRTPEMKRTCFMALVALQRLDDAFALAVILFPDQRDSTVKARRPKLLPAELTPTAYLSVPVTAPLRADPRYRDLVERVGLLQYWRSSRHPPDFCATEKVPVCRQLN